MTNWIFEFVGRKKDQKQEYIDQIIASSRTEAVMILNQMDIIWRELYALKPAPIENNKGDETNG